MGYTGLNRVCRLHQFDASQWSMNPVQFTNIFCPCCNSPMELVVDCTVMHQQYIETCEVCCRPFVVEASVLGDDPAAIRVGREDGSAHLFSHTSA